MANTTETTNKDQNRTDHSGKPDAGKNGGQRKLYAAISVILTVICLGCIIWLISYVVGLKRAEDKMDEILESYVVPMEESSTEPVQQPASEPVIEEEKSTEEAQSAESAESEAVLEESPLSGYDLPYTSVDIAALQEQQNPDIYSWISIPGTAVDYPVLQHPEEMNYYLEYNVDGTKGYPGCIYTQRMNKKDWSDKNTVLYGHNMKNGTMFAGLHRYEDPQFFEDNPYIYIYTEDNRILIYQIFAAYEYSDAHLLMMVSTGTDESYQNYLDSIFENDGLHDHFNRELELTPQDKIITLSTCISTKPTRRWLVQGVLIEEGEQLAED